ncbi:MAG: TonB-dependent receptor [Hyphococcus sp.]|nr:MAG: TonB-dependent receptor [Marinicaulis sp.]
MTKARRLAIALLSATVLVPVNGVSAQDNDGARDQVLVTGSRVKRSDLTSVGPVTVLSAAEIENTGVTNLETLLQRLPAAAGFGGNANAAYWVSNGWGTAQINLRGLGINRTLTLLNGRRVVFGGTGANSSVDLSLVPVSLISRIEVLKDGASATYGADAVAGVVNLITKTEFEGFEANAKFGITDEGDGEEYLADLVWGASGDRGNIVLGMSYQNNKAAPLADSSRAPCSLADDGSGNLVCQPGSSSTIGGRATLPAGAMLPDGTILTSPTRINFNQDLNGDGDFYEIFDIDRHGFNANPYFNASNPVERLSFATFGRYHLTDSLDVIAELLYTKKWSHQPASPATLTDIAFSASHPTNPTGVDFVLERRRLLENGARTFEQETDTFRIVTGLEGQLGDDWTYDVVFNWGRNTGSDAIANNINVGRLAETLDPAICGSSNVPCADIIGFGDISQDVLDYIVFNQVGLGGNEQLSVTANMSGALFELPAGTVGAAFGLEWRQEEGWRNPDSLAVAGLALGNQEDPIRGQIEAKEAYIEFNVPVIRDAPLIRALDIDLAYRYSDYDRFRSDSNYKFGLNWQVIDALKLRGTYTTAFRIPNVPELFGGVAEGNLTTTDPCSGWSSLSSSSTVYQNCLAAGVPMGYVQLGTTILTDRGGNPDLQPEDARSFTVGLVAEPVNGLSFTADYFNIKIDDAVRETPGSTKLAFCYNSTGLSHPFCGPDHHTRNALSGDIDFLSTQPANTGREEMSGIDLGAVYNFDGFGVSHSVNAQMTYLMKYETTAFDGDAPFVIDGFIGGGNGGYPRVRGNGSWTAFSDRWSATYSVQLIGAGRDFNATSGLGSQIDTETYHNVQFSYELTNEIRLSLGVDNLFQNDPPFVASWTDGNTDTMTYDMLGRRGYVRLTYRTN